MTFLSNVFCCFSRSVAAAPEMTEARPARPVPFRPDRQEGPIQSDNNDIPNGVAYNHVNDEGYTPNIPLPRYTPRPMSIREKTLEAHMRDPPLSSSSSFSGRQSYTPTDEKHPYAFEPDFQTRGHGHSHERVTADDVSSAFSFQSSYGNTSTATRETPPPPYSAEVSPVPTPRTRRSISSNHSQQQVQVVQQPMVQVQIAQPRAVFQRPDWVVRHSRCSIDEEVERSRRFSWESR